PLEQDPETCLYIYRLKMGGHEQTGIAACCSLDEYDQDVIRKHERTRRDKEDDRTKHMLALRAQTGPVFLTYRGRDDINRTVSKIQQNDPLFSFTAADGVTHSIWRASPSEAQDLVRAFQTLPALYIADGHHRAASASRARAELKASNQNHSGDEEYTFFITVLFPAEQVRILPYNRVVKDLNGMSAEQFIDALGTRFEVNAASGAAPSRKGEIYMYLNGRWRSLTLPHNITASVDAIQSLDVSRLQERVLDQLLGIKDIRTDKRIDFVGGIRGAAALEEMVNSGAFAVAFCMYPVTVEDLMAISDAGGIMPPK